MKRSFIGALALFGMCAAASAQDFQHYNSELNVGVNSDTFEMFSEDTDELRVLGHSNALANMTATAQISYGVNKVSAFVSTLDANNPPDDVFADSSTQWTDEVTIDGGVLNGTVGTFTATLQVFGSVNIEATGGYASGAAEIYGFWNSWVGTSTDGGASYLVEGWQGEWITDFEGNLSYDGEELNQPLTEVELEFVYGEPFLLAGFLGSYIDAYNPDLVSGTISANMDFSNSGYWNGISGVFDQGGNRVTNFALSSRSGVNWVNAVPEPGTLAVVGLGLLALRRRKKA